MDGWDSGENSAVNLGAEPGQQGQQPGQQEWAELRGNRRGGEWTPR
jgi:hypothetical protein